MTLLRTRDGATLRLTNYRGERQRPVILAPGLGVAAASYATSTVDCNLVEYLQQRGHDVWLLDYRASPACVGSNRFTLDDIAQYDWPEAVQYVVNQTGSPVQIVAHCVSALGLMMGLVSGAVWPRQVGSIICSSVAAHPVVSRMIRVKRHSRLLEFLLARGVVNLPTAYDPQSWVDRLLHHALALYPSRERCASAVCRRILFLFHDSFRHSQLDPATHAAIPGWFGPAHLPALQHVGRMIAAGSLVGANGEPRYMQAVNWPDRVNLPIALMGGAKNQLFVPSSLDQTLAWLLTSRNDPALYRLKTFPEYGHMDCFIGARAHRDVFPWIANELARIHIERRSLIAHKLEPHDPVI